jgi:hypothetical protein
MLRQNPLHESRASRSARFAAAAPRIAAGIALVNLRR